MTIREISTKPYTDQKPGTAGLRKKVSVFQQPHYLENFLQSIFDVESSLSGATIVIGGDGRYHNRQAIQTAILMAAANGVKRVIVGQGGIVSTPAASNLIRLHEAAGGFLFTASHNPAGPDGDFGVKFNIAGGGQAPESLTQRIYEQSRSIQRYRVVEHPGIDIDRRGAAKIGDTMIEVIDGVADYAKLMERLFNFDRIAAWLKAGHLIRYDALHAVTGPYARRILVDLLGAPGDAVVNAIPLEDFGGGHPDPNLVYAKPLVDIAFGKDPPELCAASDGDGDRNMILGRHIFISPGDSLAMLAANHSVIPGYKNRVHGFARSMPTSRAVDQVADKLGVKCYETPTGWKFFCNLLDAGKATICGEESFGTGSDHTREKDGLWAVLAWLNILAETGKDVQAIAGSHWSDFGRHYYARHDYEALPGADAGAVMKELELVLPRLVGKQFDAGTITQSDSFSYDDPVDGSHAEGQGLRIVFGRSARIVLRQSGTGTSGATLRLYLERYESPDGILDQPVNIALSPLATIAEKITRIGELTGRKSPTLVT